MFRCPLLVQYTNVSRDLVYLMYLYAGVIADGSVDQALRGKHCKRGVRCLRLFYETLVHHALDKRLKGSQLSEKIKVCLLKLRSSDDTQELADAYAELESNLELKYLVNTLFQDFDDASQSEYWISFMEMVEILTLNIHSLRAKKWVFTQTNAAMAADL